MQVQEIMAARPACCRRDSSLQEVARMMVEHDCGAIPVLEAGGKPVGIVTDRDIVARAVAVGKNPLTMSAGDCMTSSPRTIHPEATVEECCTLMEEAQVRRVLVVDQKDCCCGIVSQADIALSAPGSETAEMVREVSQPAAV